MPDLVMVFLSIFLPLVRRSIRPCDKRTNDANDSKAKEQKSMLDVHIAISNNMVYAWNKKKYSESNTNNSEHNSSVEDCRVLQNVFHTFLLN
jgi:hypothetical protein